MKTMSALPTRRRKSLHLRALSCLLVAGLLGGCKPAGRSSVTGLSPMSDGVLAKANRIIASALSDPDPRIRANAIEVVGSTRQIRFASQVRRLTRDEVIPVRFAACLAIADLRYAPAKVDVKQIFDEPKEDPNIRLAAAYAMVRLGSTQYADYPRKAITSTNQTLRANAALILGKAGDRQALDLLHWALQDKDSDERVILQTAESMAMLGDGRIYQKLWAKLISAYADDRIAGIPAMGALGTEQARSAVLTMLDDGVVEVRLAAAGQLGRLHDPTGQAMVLEALEKDLPSGGDRAKGEPSGARALAALAIGEIGSAPLIRFLPPLLDDASKSVQVAAAKAVFLQSGIAPR